MIGSRIDFPAFRRGYLFQRIVTVREIAFKGRFAVRIRHSNSDQRSLGQGAIRILDFLVIVETEHKAFAWNSLNLTGYKALVPFFGNNDLLDLGETDLGRQEFIRYADCFNNHGCFLIHSLQQHIIPVFIQLITGRSALFRDVVVSQRKQRAFILARGGCGNRCCNLIRLEPLGSFLADNIFHSADFIYRASQIAFVIVRRIDGMTGGILGFNESCQHHAGLFQYNLALDGRIRYEDFLRVFLYIFTQHSCRETDNQQQQAQNHRSESFFRDFHNVIYLISLSLWAEERDSRLFCCPIFRFNALIRPAP